MKSKLEKQKEADERNKARAKRSHKDQLDHLDSIFGVGVGATRERTRLQNLINKPVQEKTEKKKRSKKEKKED